MVETGLDPQGRPSGVNITTPIDEPADGLSLPLEIARAVGVDAPTLVLDPVRYEVVASNAAADRMLGLPPPRPLALDPAMPAWAAVRAGLSATAGAERQDVPLLLWTPAGPLSLPARLATLVHDGRILALVTLTAGRGLPGSAAATNRAAAADDRATLREIARRIREGTAKTTGPTAKTADNGSAPIADAPRERPPPLDFRQAPQAEPPAPSAPEPERNGRPGGAALARLAHELRTPLSAIVSLAEVIRDEQLGPMANAKYKAYAADIHDSAQYTLDLVAAMITDAAGAEADVAPADAPRLQLGTVDINALCASSSSAMQPIAVRGAVTLTVDPAETLPLIRADRRAVRQIILNLLSNALRHTPREGRIVLSTRRREEGGVVIGVADTGTGMRTAEIARALARPDAAAAPQRLRIAGEKAGLGIGLPLVRELIEAHGGKLSIHSISGQGTEVSVSFPESAAL